MAETVYAFPSPTSIKWRPDRLTATYVVAGMTIQEVKFFSRTDVVVSTISLLDLGTELDAAAGVELCFDGSSYVNVKPLSNHDSSAAGLPLTTQHSQQRNSTATADCGLRQALCATIGARHGVRHAD